MIVIRYLRVIPVKSLREKYEKLSRALSIFTAPTTGIIQNAS